MITLRLASPADAPAVQSIYAPYCLYTAISFETEPPPVAEIERRIAALSPRFPFLVAELDSHLVGYAYACPHRDRAAYRWSADVAVYCHPDHLRRGVGRALYSALFPILAELNYHRAYAGITLPNPASVALHEALGFTPVGVYRNVGFKLAQWRDVGWWELILTDPHPTNPPEPLPFADIRSSPAVEDLLKGQRPA